MKAPRYLSLFTGAGGIDLGLDAAGWECIGQCEIDDTARSVLARHWPDVHRWNDVRDVANPLSAGVEQPQWIDTRDDFCGVDLIAGGFPCQDVSVAGRRAGLAGERSGLWWEFHRVLGAVRPRAVLVENVEGLLSSNGGRDMGAIIEALVDLGYGWAYRVLDAQHFGVPQRRRRVFLLAILGGDFGAERAAEVLALTAGGGGDPPARRGTGQGTPGGVGGGPHFPRVASTLGTTRGGGHGLNAEKAAGGQLVPIVAATITSGGHSAGVNAPGRRKEDDYNLVPVVANALDRMAGGPDDNSAQANHLVTHALTRSSAKGASEDGTGRGTPLATTDQGVRRLTPRECERLMGWPDDWTRFRADGTEIADARRYAMCGNGVVAPIAEWIGARLARELAREDIEITSAA